MGYGDNTAAMLMTRGMAEMSRLVTACGGKALTVMGLAGAGDLIATCTSEHSRNRTFGKALAQGGTLEAYEERTHMVVEGALACKTICPLAQRYNVELPIATAVRSIVWEHGALDAIALELFSKTAYYRILGFGRLRGTSVKAKITSSSIHTNNVHHSYFVYRTPMGRVTIGCDGSALTHVAFGIAEFEGECRACTLTNEASSQILEYLAQKRTTFSLPLNPRGTDFQKKVWEYVLAIPYGQTRTYAQAASDLRHS